MSILSIKASDIDNWTAKEPRRAQELLPKLVWKLILASSNVIEDHHFPFEKAIQYSGYDGYLVTPDANSFFPQGTSVWEFGTDEKIKTKFNADYKKRSENPNGIDKENTTFCFVSSRIWCHREGIAEFTESKQKERIWKSVRIFDANSIEMWLDECPSVAAWFAKIIGIPCDDVMDLDSYWNYIVSKTEPKLNKDFFCCCREVSVADEIIELMEKNHSQIILSAQSKMEGILTFAADLLGKDSIKHKQFSSKIIVAISSNGFNSACSKFKNAIIIPVFENEKYQINANSSIIILSEKNGPIDLLYKNYPKVDIPARRKRNFIKALETMGYDTNDASVIASDLKCRFSPLLRKITSDINLKLPPWSNNANVNDLLPALLANSWEGNIEGDKEAIEILSGKNYNDYILSIEQFTQGDNAPIFNLDSFFACISTNELWYILSPYINTTIFENYKKCINTVFSEIDPTYELPEEKWMMASVYGKKSKFSDRIKKGLIISMTKIIELDEKENFFNFNTSCTRDCNVLVTELYNDLKTKEQWRTLIPYISDFVEAVPDSIINIIENNIKKDDEAFWCLFQSSDDPLFGRTFYVHILWALEKLMHLSDFCVRAVYALIEIEKKKSDYSLSNSPMDSLSKFFCFWLVQGCLSIDEHIKLLKIIMEKDRVIGRRLLTNLLSKYYVCGLADFQWRYVECYEQTVTVQEYYDSIQDIATCFMKTIEPCYEDWSIIIDNYSLFYPIFKNLNINTNELATNIPVNDRYRMCSKLSSIIGHKRKFSNEEDDDGKDISGLEQLYYSVLVDSPLRFAHYYSHDFYGLNPKPYNQINYDEEDNSLQKIRIKALEVVIDSYGQDAIYQLADNVPEIKFLIDSLVGSKYVSLIDLSFLIKAHTTHPLFAEKLVNSLYYIKGLSFFENIINISTDDIKWIVQQFPIRPKVVDCIKTLTSDIQCYFWENADAWGISHEEKTFAKESLSALLKHNRPYSIMRELSLSKVVDSGFIMDVLSQGIAYYPNTEKNGLSLKNIQYFYIERLFQLAYEDKSIDTVRMAQIEFSYLPIFSLDFEPTCLVNRILENPSMFVELVSLCYKDDNSINKKISKDKMNLATYSRSALDKIKRLPGQNKDGIDKDKFKQWIGTVIALSKESNYTIGCDLEIGRMLSYSPIDEDGVWPHVLVREFFEQNSSYDIINSFHIGLFNQRGVHNITGGDEEELIAKKYYDYSKKLQLMYPKTSQIIKEISENYKRDARLERARELKGFY